MHLTAFDMPHILPWPTTTLRIPFAAEGFGNSPGCDIPTSPIREGRECRGKTIQSIRPGRESLRGHRCSMPSYSPSRSRLQIFYNDTDGTAGGGRGLGLCMAEGLVEAGGTVHCLDRPPEPPKTFEDARARTRDQPGGSLEYHQVDVTQNDILEDCIAGIAAEKQRLDGLIAGKIYLTISRLQ